MRRTLVAVALAASLAGTGCRLYFWAGSHELTIPPAPSETPSSRLTP